MKNIIAETRRMAYLEAGLRRAGECALADYYQTMLREALLDIRRANRRRAEADRAEEADGGYVILNRWVDQWGRSHEKRLYAGVHNLTEEDRQTYRREAWEAGFDAEVYQTPAGALAYVEHRAW